MSWHVSAVGRPVPVLAELKSQLARITCAEPEETIKAKVGEIIEHALQAFPAASAVRVTASGSQTAHDHPEGKATNTLSLQIEPLWGFVEDKPAD